ncbi:creatininase family protein [Nesterenkonia xinjiangensis]|uniref:Creatinine amidohydrolase n=1 Tax=Nesterenkonia xinjiangensis TaxID=225327 RepID=A0A7Z0GJN2_9MICC|nr:creatininase family protein [Nesterenkonia xinjiangensis]NYJ77219.1 creatinine amidohydrolase [Nesterenkonia xinjiangensis]
MQTPDRTRITRFGDLTSPEAAQRRGALLILPVGALEQHGDGLPLSTDTLRAEYVAEAVAERLAGRAHVLPGLPYGVSPHHASFPGTVSLSARLFIDVVSSIVRNLGEAGWERILVVSGHGGNGASLGVVEQDLLATHPDLHFAWTLVGTLAPEASAKLPTAEVSGHSGESETAQVLAIAPSAVDRSSLTAGVRTLQELNAKARLSRIKPPSISVRFEHYADNGVLGDPTTVTAEQGEVILEEIVTRLTEYAEAMLSL